MAGLVHDMLELSAQIKLYHWQTKSYARHKASDSLFSEMNELIDKFVEIYIGKYERPTLANTNKTLKLDNYTDAAMVIYINKWIKYLQEKIPEQINVKDTDLLNIRDEMMGLLNNTLYLFTLS
jgi:DNA-binding ferritin-like protein